MKTIKSSIITFLLLFFVAQIFAQKQYPHYLQYIEDYKSIAISEMQRTGIPASIKLAQGIIESNAGKSTLAREANNHFGIKCGRDWSGPTFYLEDDDFDANGNKIQSCFRKYDNSFSSQIDHSEFLRDPRKVKRYGFLFNLDKTDYKAWAYGLKSAGYATSEQYPQLLINTIENYQLYRFDSSSGIDVVTNTPPSESVRKVIYNNDVKMVFARAGDTPQSLSRLYDVKISQIVKYNEKITSPNQTLGSEERVYLQKKRRSYRGKERYHYVKENESMYYISQLYGIQLAKLYSKNRMSNGSEPAVGERIKIGGFGFSFFGTKPKLQNEQPYNPSSLQPPLESIQDPGHLDMIPDNGNFDFEIPEQIPPVEKYTPKPKNTPKTNTPSTNNGSNNSNNSGSNTTTTTENTNGSGTNTPSTTNDNDSDAKIFHIVEPGETLYRIAKNYNLSVDELKLLNQLSSNDIKVGMQLRVK